jgi:phosphatidylinositol glycan class K
MLAGFPATDPRNQFPGRLFLTSDRRRNVVGPDVGVDAEGLSVNVASFLAVLTGDNHRAGAPQNLRLQSNENSSVILYLTGHGGDQFLKFHDSEELGSPELGAAISTMHARGRYGELLLMLDTCQAATMTEHIASPNVLSLASCQRGENSYAMHGDPAVGVSTVDRFTAAVLNFFATFRGRGSLRDLSLSLEPQVLRSHAVLGNHSFSRGPEEVLCSDFFAARPLASRAAVDPSLQGAPAGDLGVLSAHRLPVARLGRPQGPRESTPRRALSGAFESEPAIEVYVSAALVAAVIFGGAVAALL